MATINVSAQTWWGVATKSDKNEMRQHVATDTDMSVMLGKYRKADEDAWFEEEAELRGYTRVGTANER